MLFSVYGGKWVGLQAKTWYSELKKMTWWLGFLHTNCNDMLIYNGITGSCYEFHSNTYWYQIVHEGPPLNKILNWPWKIFVPSIQWYIDTRRIPVTVL